MIAAPILALVLQESSYVLAYPSCGSRSNAWLYVASGTGLLIALAIAAAVTYVWRTDPQDIREGKLRLDEMKDAHEQDLSLTSRHVMATVGMLVSIYMVLVVIAFAIPPFVLHPCD